MSDEGFTPEQQQYLQGFVAGTDLARSARGLPTFAALLSRNSNGPALIPPVAPAPPSTIPTGPEALHYLAQDRFVAEGKKLCPEEEAKRQKFPLDRWDELCARAEKGEFPRGPDILQTKYFGLF